MDKQQINVSGEIDIVGAILDGRKRAGLLVDDDDVVDGDCEAVECDALLSPESKEEPPDIFS